MKKLLQGWKWFKMQVAKDQHTAPWPVPVKGERYWITWIHRQQEYDFRTGKRNDGSKE